MRAPSPMQFVSQLMCGDALALMQSLPAESIDVVVTSPPYNLRNSSGNGLKDGRGGKWVNARLLDGYETHTSFNRFSVMGRKGTPIPNIDLGAHFKIIDDSVNPPQWKTLHT